MKIRDSKGIHLLKKMKCQWQESGTSGLFLTTKQDWIGLTLPSPTPSKGFLCPYLFLGSASMSKLVFTFKHKSLQDQPVHQMGRRWIIASKARWQVWCARNTKFGFQKKNKHQWGRILGGREWVFGGFRVLFGKIGIVLKDFTPAGYPSFHFASLSSGSGLRFGGSYRRLACCAESDGGLEVGSMILLSFD